MALTPKDEVRLKNGVPLFKVKAGARKPSLDLVNRLRDAEEILRPQYLDGHRQITEARLLALAVRNGGKLATFDRRLPVKAVKGASERHIRLVG